ncbi:hypothetical protein PILCRDRAFT_822488 [Piloderma croceum F 1598]|uniref:Uncharacterized protein n=1 Tax=Piloderma croceum (strain F 1598) TaxID=765440 RepID=A0A0C3BSN9_PILCF|nr:hypothetical protein PILCRDRAFT_822488 [Piloderma croceum F 1598]
MSLIKYRSRRAGTCAHVGPGGPNRTETGSGMKAHDGIFIKRKYLSVASKERSYAQTPSHRPAEPDCMSIVCI